MIVMERALVGNLGETTAGLRVIHREVDPRRPWRRSPGWAAVAPDAVVSALADTTDDAVVLARGPQGDPGAVCVAAVARLMSRTVLVLPEPFDAAAWVVALALRWSADGLQGIERALAVLCGVAGGHGPRPDGPHAAAAAVPRVHPRVLGRWALRAYVPCARCRCGGVPGTACAGCGEPLPPRPTAAASAGATVVPLRRIA